MNYKYLLFILIGIIIFLLWNKYNTFSIGNQLFLYQSEPNCTCSDPDGILYEDEISCTVLAPDLRTDNDGNLCVWTDHPTLRLLTPQSLNFDRLILDEPVCPANLIQCIISARHEGGACALNNSILQFYKLLGIELTHENTEHISLLLPGRQVITRESINIAIEVISTNQEMLTRLSKQNLLPYVSTVDLDNVNIDNNKLYSASLDILINPYQVSLVSSVQSEFIQDLHNHYSDFSMDLSIQHTILLYRYTDGITDKIIFFDCENSSIIQAYGLENMHITLSSGDNSVNITKKIVIFYAKFFKWFKMYMMGIIYNGLPNSEHPITFKFLRDSVITIDPSKIGSIRVPKDSQVIVDEIRWVGPVGHRRPFLRFTQAKKPNDVFKLLISPFWINFLDDRNIPILVPIDLFTTTAEQLLHDESIYDAYSNTTEHVNLHEFTHYTTTDPIDFGEFIVFEIPIDHEQFDDYDDGLNLRYIPPVVLHNDVLSIGSFGQTLNIKVNMDNLQVIGPLIETHQNAHGMTRQKLMYFKIRITNYISSSYGSRTDGPTDYVIMASTNELYIKKFTKFKVLYHSLTMYKEYKFRSLARSRVCSALLSPYGI